MVKNKLTRGMLTVREVSRLLHVHSNTLRRWSDHGVIKAYRIGPRGDRRFRPEDIALILLEESRGRQGNIDKPAPLDESDRYAMSR